MLKDGMSEVGGNDEEVDGISVWVEASGTPTVGTWGVLVGVRVVGALGTLGVESKGGWGSVGDGCSCPLIGLDKVCGGSVVFESSDGTVNVGLNGTDGVEIPSPGRVDVDLSVGGMSDVIKGAGGTLDKSDEDVDSSLVLPVIDGSGVAVVSTGRDGVVSTAPVDTGSVGVADGLVKTVDSAGNIEDG
jgi:hypothetical protein